MYLSAGVGYKSMVSAEAVKEAAKPCSYLPDHLSEAMKPCSHLYRLSEVVPAVLVA